MVDKKIARLPVPENQENKPKKADLYHRLCLHMNGSEAGLRNPFVRQFALIEQCEGVYSPVEITSMSLQTVKYVSINEIRRSVMQYIWSEDTEQSWKWTVDDAKKCVDMWLDLTEPLRDVSAVRFASESGWCFTKHSFNPENMKTPIWDEIISRKSNNIGAQCFIGSLFYQGSNQQQYLWLKGSGQDSKGCITRLLKKMLGESCRSANPPTKGQNPGFWLDNLMRAKCVVFNDINDRAFVTTGLGKSLTGGDIQSCERKYGASYDAVFGGKLIFTSNWTPDISSEHSDQRRIIYCELDEKADKSIDTAYEAKLLFEAPGIIYKCMAMYEKHCMPNHKPIPTDNSQALEIADENEDDFHLLMERFIVHKIDKSKPDNQQKFIHETEFTAEVRDFFGRHSSKDKAAFKKWIQRKYRGDIVFKPIYVDGKTQRVVIGLQKYLYKKDAANFQYS